MSTVKTKTGKGPAVTETYEEVIATTKETAEAAFKASTEAATKAFAISKDRVEAAVKSFDEATSFSKDTVEAIVNAGRVTAKGFEAINAEVLAYGKTAVEDGIAATKAVLGAKTLKEVVELQTEFAKSAFDSYLQQTSKLGELGAKVAQEAFEPINARVQAAVEKFIKPIAA